MMKRWLRRVYRKLLRADAKVQATPLSKKANAAVDERLGKVVK